MFGWFKKKQPPQTVTEAQPQSRSLQAEMSGLLTAHGLNAQTTNGWTYVDGDFPLLSAYCRPSGSSSANMHQLDFELKLSADRTIVESYAGWGKDENAAIGQGLFKFCSGAFHVFLSAFWNHHEPDQVEIERWTIGGQPWDAYTSALISNMSDGQTAGVPDDYVEILRQAVSVLPLDRRDHWISIYFGLVGGEATIDGRLDNDPSPELTEAVRSMAWPPAEGFYSQRQFILLRPSAELTS